MKKLLTVIAALSIVAVAFAQNGNNFAGAVKNVEKAKANTENPKKCNSSKTWLNLGNALIEAYDAPVQNIMTGMDRAQIMLAVGSLSPLSTEEVVVAGTPMLKEEYKVVNLYFNGERLELVEVTKPAVENALDLALEAFKKANELSTKDLKKEDMATALTKLADRYNVEAANAYYFNKPAEASALFAKCYDVTCMEPLAKPDGQILYNAGFTALAAKDTTTAESTLLRCVETGYYGEEASVFKSLYDIYKTQDRKDDLFAMMKKAYQLMPQTKDVLLLLIETYSTQGRDTDELFALIDTAVKNNPQDPYPVYAKGQTLEKLGRIEEAAAAYQECQTLDPKYMWGFLGEGFMYFNISQKLADEAQNEFDDKKYEIIKNKWEEALMKAVPAFIKSYEVSEDPAQKGEIAKYVKELAFQVRNVDEKFMKIYEEYSKVVEAL